MCQICVVKMFHCNISIAYLAIAMQYNFCWRKLNCKFFLQGYLKPRINKLTKKIKAALHFFSLCFKPLITPLLFIQLFSKNIHKLKKRGGGSNDTPYLSRFSLNAGKYGLE